MAHIHNEPGQHDLTVSAFIINVSDKENPKILLCRHKKLGKLLQPGGHVELDENPRQAVLREVTEETGYSPLELQVLQSAPNIVQNPSSNAVYLPNPITVNYHYYGQEDHIDNDLSFAFVTSEMPKGHPDAGESLDFAWLSLAELRALSSDDTIKNAQEISDFVLENFTKWQSVKTDKFDKKRNLADAEVVA